MCPVRMEHLIYVFLKIIEVFFVPLILGAIDVACSIHAKMDVRMRCVLMHSGDYLVLIRIGGDTFFSNFFASSTEIPSSGAKLKTE